MGVGAIGKVIQALNLSDEELWFTFTDGTQMKIFDNGRKCCERRYMHTDDDLLPHAGAILQGVSVRNAQKVETNGLFVEVQFLVVTTSRGQFTVANYNEHNGYYGGFMIVAHCMYS